MRVTAVGAEEGVRHLRSLAVELGGIIGGLSEEERRTVGRFKDDVTAAILRQTDRAER